MRTDTTGVIAYLVIAFGVAWSEWWLAFSHLPHGSGAFQLYILPGTFAPALATFIVRRFVTREGFADAGLGLNVAGWPYYIAALLIPFLVVAAIAVEATLFNLGHPDFSMTRSLAKLAPQAKLPAIFAPYLGWIVALQTPISAVVATPLLFGEEFGWRGYLQLRLFPTRPLLAAVATGIIWGLWHWPLIARGYEFPGNRYVVLAVFCVGTTLLAIILGWIKNKGSIWAASLGHAATNAIGGSLTLLWFAGSANLMFVGYLGILSWVPLALIALFVILSSGLKPRPAPA